MEKDDTLRGAVRTEKTEACSEQSFESACLCWLWGKQRERNHLKTLSAFVSDMLSQGKAENHVVEVRNKPWSPKAKNFTQHGQNTPVWKRWSGWMPWMWEEHKHITTCVIGLGDAEGECLMVTSWKHCLCQKLVVNHWRILPCRALGEHLLYRSVLLDQVPGARLVLASES